MLLPLLLAMQLASPDSMSVYNGRRNELSVRIPRLEADVVIDGSLDELAWSRAGMLTGFSQFSPSDGLPAVDSTEVLVWYSPSSIYFGIRAFEQHGQVHATLADRDRIFADDNIQILLSTFNDGRQATVFMVNPLGVQADGSLVETGQAGQTGIFGGGAVSRDPTNLNPDYVFQSKGRITEYGYEVEVRIPFKSLRYQSAGEQTWGFNVVRQIQHSGYEDSWAPARQSSASFLAQSGKLTGLTEIHRGLVLDLQPELTARVDGAPQLNGWDYQRRDPQVGGNVRWGITNNLTLNGTANPDFAQIESDAGQVTFDPRQ
ncbi:MAG: carbohydrate binding family 9 domain-containing protein, partial [Gemmatimonadota bacterium]